MKHLPNQLILLFLVSCTCNFSYAQPLRTEARALLIKASDTSNDRAYPDARAYAKSGMNLYDEATPKDTFYYMLFDEWLYNTMYAGTTDTILAYVDKYVTGAQSYYGKESERGIQSLKHKANYYYLKGEYDKALAEFEILIEAFEALENPNLKKLAQARANKALCYSRIFRLDDALIEYLEILKISKQLSENGESNEVRSSLINIGVIYWLKGDVEKATQYNIDAYEMSLRLNGRFSGYNLQSISNIIIGYTDLKNYNEGLSFVEEGITVGTKLHGEKSEYVFSMYGSKATLLMQMKKFNEAELALRKAQELMEGTQWGSIKSTLEFHNDLGVLKQKQLNFPEAIVNFNKGLLLNTNHTNKEGLDGISDYWSYYITTQRYGDCYKEWYKLDKSEEKLDSAIHYHSLLMDFLEDIREKNPSNYASTYSDKFQHNSWTYAEDFYLKNDLQTAMQIIERNKTYSNLNAINSQDILFDGVNGEQLDSVENQKAIANKIEKNLLQVEDELSPEYTATLDSLQKARVTYDELLSEIKEDNPDLYALKFEPQRFSYKKVQASLAKNECILEYSVSDSLLGIYVITADNLEARYISSVGLDTLIANTYQSIIEKKEITKSLDRISEILIGSIVEFIRPDISQLVIVPEWYLASFPFELLQLNNQQIVQNYNISYSNSTLQFLQAKEKNSNGNGEIACFVPDYNTIDTTNFKDEDIPQYAELVRSGYHNLPGAKAEVEAILEIISGISFSGKEANKNSLMNLAKDYSILHFAMHSEMNKEKPLHSALLFSSEDSTSYSKLKALELYNQSFNSDLVVLSACSSGFDRFNKGEGVLGFAKAFAYAGVPSLVYSIWKIPDNSSSYIMTHFYNHLAEGKAKDEALRLAKLDYINDDGIPTSQKSPYYWAGFIASGNMSPIQVGSKSNSIFRIGGGLLLIGLLMFIKRTSTT